MRAFILVLVGGFGCVTAFAQDLLDCVSPDVLNGLVFQGAYDAANFSSESHPLMSEVSTPPQFSLIGSTERTDSLAPSVTVAFATQLAPSAATEAAMDGLVESGWEPQQRETGFGNGVFSSAPVTQSNLACLDDQPVTVAASSVDDKTYVNYSFATNLTNSSCSFQDMGNSMIIRSTISQGMPTLDFPPDPETGEPVRSQGGGSGGSQTVRYSTTQLAHGASLSTMANHLSQQLTAQGWEADTSWSGATTAGSSWSRQEESGTPVQGMLQVTALNHSRYDVLFRIVSRQ